MNHYLGAFKKFATFVGRATRSEYWYFVLFNAMAMLILGMIDQAIASGQNNWLLSGIYYLVVLIPGLALSVRRLHDIGKSGWMLLIILIPLVGIFWYLFLLLTDSQPGDNKYGPNPKGINIVQNNNIVQ